MLQDSPLYAYIPATDLARARQFYEGKLGFKPKADINGGVVYGFGGGTAAFLYPTPNAGTSQASQAFWSVHDVDSEIAALKARRRLRELPRHAGGAQPPGRSDRRGRQGGLVQGQRRQHHGPHRNAVLRRSGCGSGFMKLYRRYTGARCAFSLCSPPRPHHASTFNQELV